MLRDRIVLFDKLVNGHETSTDAENQVVILDLHDDFSREVVVMTVTVSDKEAFHAFLRVSPVDIVRQLGVYGVILVTYVLEVHLVQLSPILDHLVELSVTVAVCLHLSHVGGELCPIITKFFLHQLKVLGVAQVLLL